MDAQLNAELENAQQCLLESFELATVYGDDSTNNPAEYLKLMATLCEIRDTSQRQECALEEAKAERTIDDFDRVYALEFDKTRAKVFDAKKTSAYKVFKKSLERAAEAHAAGTQASAAAAVAAASTSAAAETAPAEEEDLVMESDVINVIDPLTKQRMCDPVRNRLCGHHYEKQTALEAIRINKRLRCPVAGCGNKTFVQAAHLIDDEDFRARLMLVPEPEDPLG